jgi:hypothetical protein
LALAQIPEKSGVEKILRDLASDPVVVAVVRYVNRQHTNSANGQDKMTWWQD